MKKSFLSLCALVGIGLLFQNLSSIDYVNLQSNRPAYVNPVLDQSGDPGTFKFGGRYYMYLPYNSDISGNYSVNVSNDMVNWPVKKQPDLLFEPDDFPKLTLWSPSLYYSKVSKSFFLYYSVVLPPDGPTDAFPKGTDPAIGNKDIGVAVSQSPIGPFKKINTASGDSALFGKDEPNAFIDPSPFEDDDGQLYLVYKYRGPNGSGNRIFLQKMATPIKKEGRPVLLMSNNPEDGWIDTSSSRNPNRQITWEKRTLEQPFLFKTKGIYYLFYSGNEGNSKDYGIGVLVSKSLGERFVKPNFLLESQLPLLGASEVDKGLKPENSIYGPGAATILTDYYNRQWIVYRQKKADDGSWKREVHIDRISFSATGIVSITPTRGTPAAAPITGP